jgi:DNA adenine methylase
MTANITRPVLKYYGGKFRLAPWIISHFPAHEVYIEPFSGAASVLLLKSPARYEVYNDLNKEVVNLFRVVRDPLSARKLRHLLRLTPYSRTEWIECFEPTTDPIEQARRSIVKSLMSVGNSQEGEKPKGFRVHTKNYHYLPQYFHEYQEHLKAITNRLLNVTIENIDAVDLMLKNDRSNVLFYVDPPYLNRRRMDHGYNHEMKTEAEHEQLLNVLKGLKGMVVLSGYEHDMYFDLLKDWKTSSKNSVTGSRTKGKCSAREILFMNPSCFEQKQLTIF